MDTHFITCKWIPSSLPAADGFLLRHLGPVILKMDTDYIVCRSIGFPCTARRKRWDKLAEYMSKSNIPNARACIMLYTVIIS